MALIQKFIRAFLRAVFKLLYEVEIRGLENVPADGPVIIAYNHTNTFDGPFILAFTPRPLRFIVAAFALKVPFWDIFQKLYGSIPVRRGTADFGAIRTSIDVLKKGGGFAIAPEGTYTTDGHMVPAKQGTALIAMKTGAPIVPATITGAFHSWPRLGPQKRRVPRPWRLGLTFHEPIRISPEEMARHREDKAFEKKLTQRIVDSLNRTLEPALREDARIDNLLRGPGPPIRYYEIFPLLLTFAAAILLGIRTHWFTDPEITSHALWFLAYFLAIGTAYLVYLVRDACAPKQTILTRALRNFSPLIFLILFYPPLTRYIPSIAEAGRGADGLYPPCLSGLPPPLDWLIVDWLFITYFTAAVYLIIDMRYYYLHRHHLFERFLRGVLLSIYAALLLVIIAPAVGSDYPLELPDGVTGAVTHALAATHNSRLTTGSFPAAFVTLTLYFLMFDCLNHRKWFNTMLPFAASGVAAAVFLHGYPPLAVGVNALIAALIMVYTRFMPVVTHGGRHE